MEELEEYIGRVYIDILDNIFKIIDINMGINIFDFEIQWVYNNYISSVTCDFLNTHCTDITDLYNTEGYQLLLEISK